MKQTLLLAVLLASASVSADPSKQPLIVTATALKLELLPDGVLLVTLGAGARYGVTMAATCAFIDQNNKVVSTDCTMVKVDDKATVVRSKTMRMDDVKAAGKVMFTVPRN
jgi:hypothetical protein